MKLTKEFVEGFLERYDGDLSGPILDIAGSAAQAVSFPPGTRPSLRARSGV